MKRLLRIIHHPEGRAGLAIGFTVGLLAVAINGTRRILLLWASLIAFWQHAQYFKFHVKMPLPSFTLRADKEDQVQRAEVEMPHMS